MRILLLLSLATSSFLTSANLFASQNTTQTKPNILFLFADDQCFETIRAFGKTDIDTPNLDRLAKSGTTFTHCYNQGSWSGAVCVASRTMLVTGRFVWNANKVYQKTNQELSQGRFWPSYMKSAGYDTYFTGKWHIRAKAEQAFDVTGHVRGGMPNQTPQGYNRPLPNKEDPWSPWDTKFGGFWAGGKHWSEVVGDETIQFLHRSAKSDHPFFMYIAFNAAHDPRQSPKEYVEKYPLSRMKVPENFLPEYPNHEKIGCGKNLRDEKLGPFPRTEHAVKVHRQEYYALITHMDTQIGRILDALEKTGQAKNTWIFFTADHGLAVGHHGLFGKQNMHEHSVRVPFIVKGPGVEEGKIIDTSIYLQDVMPTTLELANVPRPDHVQFKSLLPLLSGKAKSQYDAIYGGYLQVQRMVRLGDYKLILYPQANQSLLYNLKEDPLEMHNLRETPAAKPIVRKLYAKLLELQKETGDQLDISQFAPE